MWTIQTIRERIRLGGSSGLGLHMSEDRRGKRRKIHVIGKNQVVHWFKEGRRNLNHPGGRKNGGQRQKKREKLESNSGGIRGEKNQRRV